MAGDTLNLGPNRCKAPLDVSLRNLLLAGEGLEPLALAPSGSPEVPFPFIMLATHSETRKGKLRINPNMKKIWQKISTTTFYSCPECIISMIHPRLCAQQPSHAPQPLLWRTIKRECLTLLHSPFPQG